MWKLRHSHESSKEDISDGLIFHCGTCKTTKLLRAGSFFSKSKITLQKWMVVDYWWVRDYPVSDAAEEAHVEKRYGNQCLSMVA